MSSLLVGCEMGTVGGVDECGGADCGKGVGGTSFPRRIFRRNRPSEARRSLPPVATFITSIPSSPRRHCVNTTHEHDHHQIVHFHLHLSISWMMRASGRRTTTLSHSTTEDVPSQFDFNFDDTGWPVLSSMRVQDIHLFPCSRKMFTFGDSSTILWAGRRTPCPFSFDLVPLIHPTHHKYHNRPNIAFHEGGHHSLCTQTKSHLRRRCSLVHPLRSISPPTRPFHVLSQPFDLHVRQCHPIWNGKVCHVWS